MPELAEVHGGPHPARSDGGHRHLHREPGHDFCGNLNYTYEVPFPVSGLCANGVIACDPGTWTNCQTYEWTWNAIGEVSLAVVPFTALGGCFCVNNSCGTNLVFGNTPTIMNVIGGGVAGAIQAYDARYAISNVVIDGMDATYYGQNSGACIASSSMPANAEQYYYNPGNMSSDAAAQAARRPRPRASTAPSRHRARRAITRPPRA